MTTIEVQPKHEQHLARWKQLGADRELAKLPYKIETDRLGRILCGTLDIVRGSIRFLGCGGHRRTML